MTTKRARRIAGLALAVAALFVLSACKNVGPQDFLNPEGPLAKRQHRLFVPVFWIATGVFVLVEGMILVALLKYRERKGAQAPVQTHGNTRLEIGWTIAPAALLAGIAVPVVLMIFSLAEVPKGPDVVNVRVVGHQWWWEYQYTDTKPAVKTATELVIPTGRKVHLKVTSVDVLHSFWVPKLGGKQDAVPGRDNPLTIEATDPGTYHGQCAEFCALSHANMRLRVVALPPAEFDAWLKGQQRDAVIPAAGLAAEGARVFAAFGNGTCMQCHTLRGIEGARGEVGPDLTHFASRATFAGAIFDLDAKTLETWLRDPPAVKPGSIMPNYHIPADAIRALVQFLLSLK